MLASTHTGAVAGIRGQIIRVEVDSAAGFPGLSIVGLPDSAIRESESRIKAALRNSGFNFSWDRRITINLAPAHVRKTGSAFDLAIAVALLGVSGEPLTNPGRCLFLGELALDGSLRTVPGVLPIVIEARAQGFSTVLVAHEDRREASLVSGIMVRGVRTLLEAMGGDSQPSESVAEAEPQLSAAEPPDLRDVVGQPLARRALEIAAAGRHNVLMIGPPGSGKTMLARRLPGILPPPSADEALEMTAIQSAAGLSPRDLVTDRPFRAPHHTTTMAALVGGGALPRPGEISLAHGGVLFLDELPEFPRATLEALRQPLEEGRLTVSRSRASFEFPSRLQLIAAMNPCPCGYRDDPVIPCRCTPQAVARYQGRISGPLLDRIDIVLDVPRPEIHVPTSPTQRSRGAGECSAHVRQRIAQAIQFAADRNERLEGSGLTNVNLETAAARTLESAAREQGLSLRAVHRTARVARTIADLSHCRSVQREAVLEALMFRPGIA